jgi:SAM-dependent methyltransferase
MGVHPLVRARLSGYMSAAQVASAGVAGLLAGREVVVPGLLNRLLAWSSKLSPHSSHSGDGSALPFGDRCFDLVATRLTFHHMTDPRPVLCEMVRVTRQAGTVLIGDMLCAEDPTVAARQNALERARDPSHVRTLARDELLALGEAEGLAVRGTARWALEVRFDAWARLSSTPKTVADEIRAALTEDIGKGQTGFQPFLKDGELYFIHEWGAVSFAVRA